MRKHLFVRLALAALLSAGMYAFAAPAPTTHAAPPASHTIIRSSSSMAIASFSYTQGGNVTDFVSVIALPEGVQQPTPISGPAAGVSVVECTQVGENSECVGFLGMEPAPGLQFDTHRLTSVTLPEVTVPVSPMNEFGMPSGSPVFDVSVALTWTGVGSITSSHSVSHYRVGHTFIETSHFKGLSRDATVSGAISYPSPQFGPITLTGSDAVKAALLTNASMDITIQR